MTGPIVFIVEGDGEVRAIPVLLRRLAQAQGIHDPKVPPPIRVRRDQFLNRGDEFERKIALASAKAQGGTLIVLLDADDDCPVTLANDVENRAKPLIHGAEFEVVIANREYEAWLIAAAESLAGKRGLRNGLLPPGDPDAVRDAKGWISNAIPAGRYHEVSDQPALTAVFDIEAACTRSRSLRKLVSAVQAAFARGVTA